MLKANWTVTDFLTASGLTYYEILLRKQIRFRFAMENKYGRSLWLRVNVKNKLRYI